MGDDVGLLDLQMVEQRHGVAREIVEMQVALLLGRFAEADLIGHHDPIAGAAQDLDDRGPVAGREIASVQQHYAAAVRLCRLDVHVGHLQRFAVIDDRQQADGVGVGETFEVDAIGLARRIGGGDRRQRSEKDDSDGRRR